MTTILYIAICLTLIAIILALVLAILGRLKQLALDIIQVWLAAKMAAIDVERQWLILEYQEAQARWPDLPASAQVGHRPCADRRSELAASHIHVWEA
jgi:hypothetical protein